MNLIQDIPKSYTALAEWLFCLVFVLLLKRRLNKGVFIIVMGLYLPFLMFLHYCIGVSADIYWIPLMALAMVSMFLCLLLCYRISLIEAGYYWAIAFLAAEFMAAFEWQIYSYILNKGLDGVWFKFAFLFMWYFSAIVGFYLIQRKYMAENGVYSITVKGFLGFLLSALATFLMSNISYAYPDTPFSSSLKTEVFYIRTLVDFAGLVILFVQQDRWREIRLEKELSNMNFILIKQYEQYKQSKESIDLINQKYHDFKHQIEIIKDESDKEIRDSYLSQMESGLKLYESRNNTGNTVLDTILTAKNMFCVKHNIKFSCVADGSLLEFIDTMDLCSIFGNILDNAIESVEKLDEEDKKIVRVSVYSYSGFVMIRTENYFESDIKMVNKIPLSSKKNKEYHGFGLKNVKRIISNYDGTMNIKIDDNWFYLYISIPIPV